MNGEIRWYEILLVALGISLLQVFFSVYFPPALFVDLTLIYVLYLGWRTSPVRALFAGTFLGLLQDASLLMPYWGLNGLTKAVAAYAAISLSRWIWLEGTLTRMVTIFVVSLMDSIVAIGLLFFLGRGLVEPEWFPLVLRASSSAVIGVLFFRMYDGLKIPVKDFRQRAP